MKVPLAAGLIRLLGGANPRWVGCQPDERQRVYFANHTSHLDAAVLWACLPPALRAKTRPAAAKDYWEADPLRRFLAQQVFQAILIDRTRVTAHHNPIELLVAGMGDHFSLILFPEGGRGTGETVGPFKSGLYHLAKAKPEVELIPVFIDNMNRILPKGEFLPVPLLSSISFGAPLDRLPDEAKPAFLERAREAVCQLQHT